MSAATGVLLPTQIIDRAALRRQRIFGIFYLALAAVAAFILPGGIDSDATTSFGLNPVGASTGSRSP